MVGPSKALLSMPFAGLDSDPELIAKASPAIVMAIAGAVALKRKRSAVVLVPFAQNEITRASITTVIVPAAGPKSNTVEKMKVSETDRLAGSDGSFTVKLPAMSVRAMRKGHSLPGGAATKACAARASARAPTTATMPI